MTIELADLTSYFQEVLILDYYDGPMAGVGLLPDRSEEPVIPRGRAGAR